MSGEGEIGHQSVGMMQKLLPILLYIRNYNEYKRYQHSVSSRNPRKNFSNNSAVKILTVSQQITAYYEAEARLSAQRHARAEARQIRMKELEKQQKEFEETSDRHYEMFGKSGRTGMKSGATKAPATGSDSPDSSSRRSSDESLVVPDFSNAIEFRHQFNDLDDKYRKAMVNNAQLDNERQVLTYQVDLYKDDIEEFEENIIRLQKDFKDKSRTSDQLNRDLKNLQKDCDFLRECLRQRDCLIEEAGLVLMDSDEYNPISHSEYNHRMIGINGDISDKRSESLGDDSGSESGIGGSATTSKTPTSVSLVSQEAAQLLAEVDGHTLEAKLKTLLNERQMFAEEVDELSAQLEQQRLRSSKLEELTLIQASHSSIDSKLDIQREANRLVSDYNFKLKQSEQEINVLNGTVERLEAQLARHRAAAEESEQLEDELKSERRKLQRELREVMARVEELETSNTHLEKRIDKLKTNRNIIPNSN